MSDNYLNTVSAIAGVGYDKNTMQPQSELTLRFSKFYPIFDLSAGYNGRREIIYDLYDEDTLLWNETYATASMTVPFDFSRETWSRTASLNTSMSAIYQNNRPRVYANDLPEDEVFPVFGVSASFSNNKYRALRNLAPKLGQNISAGFEKVLGNGSALGQHFYVNSTFYFPGLFHNHAFILRGAAEFQSEYSHSSVSGYKFANQIVQSRGQYNYGFNSYHKLSIDYKFPIWYPDLGGYLVYFKRLSGGIFYDTDWISNNKNTARYNRQTIGFELFMQSFFFGLNVPIDLGARVSFPEFFSEDPVFEFVAFDIPLN